MKKLVLKVEGMKCGGCASKIKGALCDISASEVEVDHGAGRVELTPNEGVRTLEVKKAIEAEGFRVTSFEQN